MSVLPTTFRASLLQTARLINDEINTILLPHQINSSFWQALYVIHKKNGCTSIEIAEYLNVSKPSIAKRINALIDLELLEQIPTEDKRQKKFILSTKGKALYKTCSSLIDDFENNLLEDFLDNDIGTTKKLLMQLSQKLLSSKQGNENE